MMIPIRRRGEQTSAELNGLHGSVTGGFVLAHVIPVDHVESAALSANQD